MLTIQEEEYYARQTILPTLGKSGQLRLKNAKVAVVGAGGLGCPALSYLAGAGIRHLTIIDGDTISSSNLHRQLLFGVDDVGKSKAQTAKHKLLNSNPHLEIETISAFLTPENAESILQQHDVILDCTDNYATRYLINDVCYLLKIPMIYGAIHRFEGQMSVFHYQNGPTYRCMFSVPPAPASQQNCAVAGVIGVIPGMIGLLQATEAIKIITGIGEVLSGKVLFYNALKSTTYTVQLPRRSAEHLESFFKNGKLNPVHYQQSFCASSDLTISMKELERDKINQYQWIDVREKGEEPLVPEDLPILHLPLSKLMGNSSLIDKNKTSILFCQSGVRSLEAAEQLEKQGFTTLKSLKEGINPQLISLWKQHLKSFSLKEQ